ncbi:MAG: geranylgeranylglycerol-phosphate geranylgeranyltransferase [bacterium]
MAGTDITAKLKSIAQLIRLPNILLIILTQFLLRYSILVPFLYQGDSDQLSGVLDFSILVLTTVLITIGGYVINDYFDLKIDQINKPEKLVVNKLISQRQAIKLHLILNGIAIILGFYLAFRVRVIAFGLIFPVITGLLWFYSAKYKSLLVWGNLIVALLSSLVVLIVWLFEFFTLKVDAERFLLVVGNFSWVTRLFLIYALFSFLVSFIREIIKDVEDWKGDETFGCRTLPVVLGLKGSKWIVAGLTIITMIFLGRWQIIFFRLEFNMVFWYFMIAVQLPTLYLLLKLITAREKGEFHFLSNLCKVIMLAGILSMQILYISSN